MKPIHREPEGHAFDQRRRPIVAPVSPEIVVGGGLLEEVSQFVDVISAQVSTQQVAHQMPRGVRQRIPGMENGDIEPFDIAKAPALPQSVRALDVEALRAAIPEPEVQFDGERHIGIVVITTGTPARFANQR